MGYHRAGFEVVGVDINPQPHYPFEFHQGDAMSWPLDGFDVIHASPPCQAFTAARRFHKREHPNHIPGTRSRLTDAGVPFVIENVVGAPVRADLMLCGTMFGIPIRRHRLFESNRDIGWPPFACSCAGQSTKGVLLNHYNTAQRRRYVARAGRPSSVVLMEAIGVEWMSRHEASESIPPAYTEWIGRQL